MLELTKALAKPFKAITRIPFIDDTIEKARLTYLNPVVVRLVVKPESPKLAAALDIFERCIPEDRRVEPAAIVRWIREDRQERRRELGILGPMVDLLRRISPLDVFLVAVFQKKVCGLCLLHYYQRYRLGLLAYLVSVKRPGLGPNTATDALMSKIGRMIRRKQPFEGCKGILIEVEDPTRQKGPTKRESLARVRRFRRLAEIGGFALRAVDMNYLQPPLSHVEQNSEKVPLLLMIAAESARSQISRDELAELLKFIYVEVYPGGYSDSSEETAAYSELCRRACEEAVQKLPATTNLLSYADLLSRGSSKLRQH